MQCTSCRCAEIQVTRAAFISTFPLHLMRFGSLAFSSLGSFVKQHPTMKLFTPRESCLWLKTLWEHSRNQRMTRPQLEAMQMTKFRRLVAFVQNHSPYYQRIIKEHGIHPATCVPTDFPVLTKKEAAQHFDELITERSITRERIAKFLSESSDPADLFDGRFRVLHTSGTSGTVGYFVFSQEAWIRGASHASRVAPLGWRRRTAFVAATRGHFAGASLMLTGNEGSNHFFYDVRTFDVGQPLPKIIEELNAFQPQALSGYATMIKVLAEAKERGDLRISPKYVGNGGEPLLPQVKSYLERVFQVPILNAYASSEHLYMALTLPGSDGMYLMEDDLIFELHHDHTCVTNLFNPVMPLIRYRMDDVLVPDLSGPHKLPFTKVKALVGRQEHALEFRNQQGQMDFIHPIVIVELMVPGLNAWQIVLTSETSFLVRARWEEGLTDAQRRTAHELLHQKFNAILAEKEMSNVTFEVEEAKAFAVDPHSGKFRLVLRKSDIEAGTDAAFLALSPALEIKTGTL